jgi:hypothetical protein
MSIVQIVEVILAGIVVYGAVSYVYEDYVSRRDLNKNMLYYPTNPTNIL